MTKPTKKKNLRASAPPCETKSTEGKTSEPKLRFPEFRKAEGWEIRKAGTLFTNRVTKGEHGLPLYSVTMHDGMVRRDSLDRNYYDIEDAAGNKKACRNDIAYNMMRMWQGASGVAPEDCLVSPAYIVLAPTKDAVPMFFQYMFKLPSALLTLTAHSRGLTKDRLRLYYDDFARIPLRCPSAAEQQKIAECLSSVDDLIAAQARKVDALKTHKKGLMQQLFPREGETQPRLRFPEFQNAGGWEVKSLGQLIEIASGQVDPKQPPYCDYPQIGSEDIKSDSGKLINVKSAAEKGVISGNYAFDENDILYSKIRPALNKVAAPAFCGICSADIYPIRPADANLLKRYLFYLLLSQDFLKYAIRNSERGKIPKINRDALVTYKTLIPSPAEQQRIAACLSSLDDLITAEGQKLEVLKTHKRGLMQQLFPAPEQVEA